MWGIKNNKILPLMIVGAIFFVLFLSLDFETYQKHHTTASHVVWEQKYLENAIVIVGPHSEDWVLNKINHARKRIWVGVYTFTLPNMREALLRAKKTGVDVRVILEKNPFGNTSINRETIQFFRENNIDFHESTEQQFSFMHAKYMIFDDEWILETANWTRSSFSSNREFFISWSDSLILENLAYIFENDFAWWIWTSRDLRLLAGPTNARERLTLFLEKASQSIDIYAPDFSDSLLIDRLDQICQSGRRVRLLIADYPGEDEQENHGDCIQTRKMKKPLHAKVLIRDKWDTFVGSFNYTKNSLENNREMGLFLSWSATKSISQTFESDWKQAEVALH